MPVDTFAHNPRTLLHIATDLRSRGVSPVEVFGLAGVSPSQLLDPNGWVPRDICFALGEAAAIAVSDRFFASRIGQTYGLTALGVWGRTIVGAANVAEACEVAAKSVGLLHQGSSLRFLIGGSEAQLRLEYRGRIRANPRQHLIGSLAILRKIALLANAPEAITVRFSMPSARGVEDLEETHGYRLEFDCDYDAVVIDRALLDAPVQGSRVNDATRDLDPPETAEAVGASLKHLLPYGQANIRTVAAQMQVSTRTVQRRLREWGFSFEEILDDLRKAEAIRHARSGEHTAIEIAFLLGYSDPSHFTSAFRRWTGMAPREYSRTVRKHPI